MIHWLASYPKSGNTWARYLYQAYLTGVADIRVNLRCVLFDAYEVSYQNVCPVPVDRIPKEHFVLLRGAQLLGICANSLMDRLVVKTHAANTEVNAMPVFPRLLTESAVYLMRDPRDVAVSWAAHLGKSIEETIELMANDMAAVTANRGIPQYVLSWSLNVESWMDKATVIRYEDLKVNPVHWFSKMLETWGIEVDEERLAWAVEATHIDNFRAQEQESGFSERTKESTRPFFHGETKWQDVLSDEQAQKIRKHHGRVMARFNYG